MPRGGPAPLRAMAREMLTQIRESNPASQQSGRSAFIFRVSTSSSPCARSMEHNPPTHRNLMMSNVSTEASFNDVRICPTIVREWSAWSEQGRRFSLVLFSWSSCEGVAVATPQKGGAAPAQTRQTTRDHRAPLPRCLGSRNPTSANVSAGHPWRSPCARLSAEWPIRWRPHRRKRGHRVAVRSRTRRRVGAGADDRGIICSAQAALAVTCV